MNLKQQRDEALATARQLAEGVKADGRGFTDDERKAVEGLMAKADDLAAQIKTQQAAGDELLRQVSSLGVPPGSGVVKSGRLSFKSMTRRVVEKEGTPRGVKSLISDGSQVVGLDLIAEPKPMEKALSGLLDAIPAQVAPRNYGYLSQTTRTNNAAPVADGDTKPTSVYGLTQEKGELVVVAHLSEPVNTYWLEDNPALMQFVQSELVYGLQAAVEAQILTGDGTDANMTGIANTTGIQTEAFDTDGVVTARNALGAAEVLGFEGGSYVLHPDDWKAIELKTLTDGAYMMNDAPIVRATRRLWGVPVVLSTALTAGTGYYLADGSVTLFTDQSARVEWAVTGDGFKKNEVTARAEGRFNVGVLRPKGCVEMTLTDAG